MTMVVNVCPAASTKAPPDRVWAILTAPERFGEWNDARYVSSEPPGSVRTGQVIHFTTRAFGRSWPVDMTVGGLDPGRRWIELRIQLPFGVVNQERITLADADGGGTLVRFN